MKRVIAFAALSLAICALLLAPIAGAAKGERPFKIKGIGVLSPDFRGQDEGQVGPGGSYTNEWQIDPATGNISGTITVANGDQLEWSGMIEIELVSGDPVMTTYTITGVFTGGTGRFAEAGGDFVIDGTGTQIGDTPSLGITVMGSGRISY